MSTKWNTPKSYSEYLTSIQKDPTLDYENTVKNVSLEADAASPTRGKSAEALASYGLTNSGYAAFLKNEAEAAKKSALSDAKSAYQTATAKTANAYRDYVEDFLDKNNTSFESVVSSIKRNGTVNEADAYTYALRAGLPENYAKIAANAATVYNINELKKSVIEAVQRDGMGREHAIAYAKGQGLSDELAEEIGDYADSWNRIYKKSDSIQEYYK